MTELSPKTNTMLFGHEEAEALLLRDLAAGKLAHGWLISGPPGIGKATLAYRFARTLLASDERAAARIIAGSHADLLVIEQRYDEKKEEKLRDISVEQAREIAQFLSLTPGEGRWRVVIIDSIDALNVNAANAILKILEEPPPQAILLLISHNPGRLLPTLRSRCRQLRLTPLDNSQFLSIMRHVQPAIESGELPALAQLSGMAPGIALALHAQGAVELYGRILALLSSLPTLDMLQIHAFADQIGTGQVHANWQLWTRLVLFLLERLALTASEIEVDPVSEGEALALRKLASLHPAPVWAEKWQQASDQFMMTERLHLDYKQVIITFLHAIKEKSGEWLVAS